MKTTSQVIADSGIPAALVRAVVGQFGDKSSLEDVARHGADGGYPGFTYYKDTIAFFKRQRVAIVEIVKRMADDLGETPIAMVAQFGCLGGRDAQRAAEYEESVSRCLYGGRLTDDDTQVANALAWYALEEVARAFCDE